MITISLCMIVKNEADVLARCLDCTKEWADEIIIIDTGSTDSTKDIAAGYTDRVYDFEWIDDFAAARNYSFSKAAMDYCMWLDADDIISPKDQAALVQLKATLKDNVDFVMMKYHTAFDEKGNPTFSYYRERLIKNNKNYQWLSPIHEAIAPQGIIEHSEIGIIHSKLHPGDPDRNLNIFNSMLKKGIEFDPRQQFYYGRELYDHQKYSEAVNILNSFLDAGLGWLENQIEACRCLSLCYDKLDQKDAALGALLRSLTLDTPRAELCCDIGNHFLEREQYPKAIFWYELAAARPRRDHSGGFILKDCYDYIPALQLCVCYDRMGDFTTASFYNEKAGAVKPDSPAYLYNKDYFQHKLEDN